MILGGGRPNVKAIRYEKVPKFVTLRTKTCSQTSNFGTRIYLSENPVDGELAVGALRFVLILRRLTGILRCFLRRGERASVPPSLRLRKERIRRTYDSACQLCLASVPNEHISRRRAHGRAQKQSWRC